MIDIGTRCPHLADRTKSLPDLGHFRGQKKALKMHYLHDQIVTPANQLGS